MKKIVAVFLALAMLTVFVSCGDSDNNQDDPTINTNVGVPNVESTTAADTGVSGYVLTTDPNQTVPSGFMVDYVPTSFNQTVDPSSGLIIPSLTDEHSTTPIPSMSQVTIPSTQPTSNNGNNGNNTQTGPTVVDAPDNTTKPSDPQEQDATTENNSGEGSGEGKPVAKPVSSSSASKLSNGDITVDISASGWDSAIISNKGTATVSYGSNTESAACSVSATVEGGNYVITVYTSKLEIYSGATVKITIPEGLIKTASGTQYNKAFTSKSITY